VSNILVIGDPIIDKYVFGRVTRQSPEDEYCPIVDYIEEEYRPGGSWNVACNLWALHRGGVTIFDVKGKHYNKLSNYYFDNIHKISAGYGELIKARIINRNGNSTSQICRIDNKLFFSSAAVDSYANRIIETLKDNRYDAIVVSDYNKGLVSPKVIKAIRGNVNRNRSYLFVDTKKPNLDHWSDLTNCFVKLNAQEFDVCENDTLIDNLIVTNGSTPTHHWQKGECIFETPVLKNCNAEVTGCGDVFLAGFVSKFMENKDIHKAMEFANKVAAINTYSFGTSVVKV
jgi:D-beta-D-heptose 7-phosphate kinase/D-beta-D-heptose 1-phosphate adenosyltransferase